MANVLVFGHQNPDNDAIMSAVVLSQLLNQVEYAGNTYEACALGQLPAESAKLLADAGIAEPRVIESVEAGQLVVLTDHNESAQSVAGLKDATVFGVVDHHRIGDFETAGPLHYICLPLGSSCTIVTKLDSLTAFPFVQRKTPGCTRHRWGCGWISTGRCRHRPIRH